MNRIIGQLFVVAMVVAPGIDEVVVAGDIIIDEKVLLFRKYIGAWVVGRPVALDIEGEEQRSERGGKGEVSHVRSWKVKKNVKKKKQVQAWELGEEWETAQVVDGYGRGGGEEESSEDGSAEG